MPTVFINGSSRKRGNTAILGERFLDNFPHQTYHLVDYRLNFVHDHRGTDDGGSSYSHSSSSISF